MKIAIVVHGRFHAFALADALIRQGHDVIVFTNYPKRVVSAFGVPRERVRTNVMHGIVSRLILPIEEQFHSKRMDPLIHRWFGRWACRQLLKDRWDVIHLFSGIAEETLNHPAHRRSVLTVVRGSAHIRTQERLLREEEARAGVPIDRPGQWMIAREEREYAKAEAIFVLSTFAWDSFVAEGVPAAKLRLVPLGSAVSVFRPDAKTVEERRRRMLSGEPLRVLTTGVLSYQKGVLDLAAIMRECGDRFRFRVVGRVTREASALARSMKAELLGHVSEEDLPRHYAWADVFLFPTIHDGFALVLAQAQASGLPFVASTNCAAPDLLRGGACGWVLPVRNPEAFVKKLRWCDENRALLSGMCDTAAPVRDWAGTATRFAEVCRDLMASRKTAAAPLRVAIVVHGRFHSFGLARELIRQGHHVLVFTNCLKSEAERFRIPRPCVKSCFRHRVALRVLSELFPSKAFEPWLHRWFGRWAARRLFRHEWDVAYVFSGIAEEILSDPRREGRVVALVRGSSHIRVQARLLVEEETRSGRKIDRPSEWMIRREEREYALAEHIFVLSTFARDSFLAEGVPAAKLTILPLGSDTAGFRPSADVLEARRRRILSGDPLRILTVGSFSLRKGAVDYVRIVAAMRDRFRFRFVGGVLREAAPLARRAAGVEFVSYQRESSLPAQYAWADVFLFTTLEDGYAVVLSQAQASGLPILATTNCAAPDIVAEGRNGWIVPIRDAEAFMKTLSRMDADRPALAGMASEVGRARIRDWSDVAADFAAACRKFMAEGGASCTRKS